MQLGRLGPDTRVYKEECVYCFENVRGERGINVCLACFTCLCDEHGREHAERQPAHGWGLNIHQIREEVEEEDDKAENKAATEPAQKLTKLAIGVEGGAQVAGLHKWHTETQLRQLRTGELEPNPGLEASELAARLLAATDVGTQGDAVAWELSRQACEHTLTLQQEEGRAKTGSHCGMCDLEKPMWMCLTCGHLGCGRPLPAPISAEGGRGHALDHRRDNPTHVLVCKMGTITPEGGGDVYCYGCDEDVVDPNLGQHLAAFGIAVLDQQKTEMSMQELELEQNKLLDILSTEDGQNLEEVRGPGLTGLRNIGNTCYMASVVQALLAAVPEVWPSRYSAQSVQEHHSQCRELEAARCWACQTGKLVQGMLDGSHESLQPRMWKQLATRGSLFAGVQQQDSFEFFQFVVKKIREREGPHLEKLLSFNVGNKVQCTQCRGQRRASEPNTLDMRILMPMGDCEPPLTPAPEGETAAERLKRQYLSQVPFMACLKNYAAVEHIHNWQCPQCNKSTVTEKTQSLDTFPDVLVIQMQRFAYENWLPQKLSMAVSGLENGPDGKPAVVDLGFLQTQPLEPGATLLPEDPAQQSKKGENEERADEAIVTQLELMGFSRVQCERAAFATGNVGPEEAMNHLLAHMDDPALNVPLKKGGSNKSASSFDPAVVVQLTSMGFGDAAAHHALRECDGNVERAVDWLFSHPDAGQQEAPAGEQQEEEEEELQDREADGKPKRYRLESFILHKGNQIQSGHYVNYSWNEKHQSWVVFDDERVALSVKPPIDQAYVYIFRRVKE